MKFRHPYRSNLGFLLFVTIVLAMIAQLAVTSTGAAAQTLPQTQSPAELAVSPTSTEGSDAEGQLEPRLAQLRVDFTAVEDARALWDTIDADRIDTKARRDAAIALLAASTPGSPLNRSLATRRDRLTLSLHESEQLTITALRELLLALHAARDSAAQATEAIAASGTTDMGAEELLAYRDVAVAASLILPQCALRGSLLAALGRSRLTLADRTQTQEDPVGLNRLLHAMAMRDAQALCAGPTPLDTDEQIASAIRSSLAQGVHDKSLSAKHEGPETFVAAERRYARNPVLGLGGLPLERSHPARPRVDPAKMPALTPKVMSLLSWGTERLGTPYSQCLGSTSRPQDPNCPPGADRFGNGYFDCSGFVHAAFEAVGIDTPTTTDSMQSDEDFLSHTVATQFDETVRSGDIFLMEGHTGIIVGDGRIMHAYSTGLVIEPLPDWIRDRTFAIVRLITSS